VRCSSTYDTIKNEAPLGREKVGPYVRWRIVVHGIGIKKPSIACGSKWPQVLCWPITVYLWSGMCGEDNHPLNTYQCQRTRVNFLWKVFRDNKIQSFSSWSKSEKIIQRKFREKQRAWLFIVALNHWLWFRIQRLIQKFFSY
jgi:hypothetical protein